MAALKFTLKMFIMPIVCSLAVSAALFAIIEIAAKHMGELCLAAVAWIARGGK